MNENSNTFFIKFWEKVILKKSQRIVKKISKIIKKDFKGYKKLDKNKK